MIKLVDFQSNDYLKLLELRNNVLRIPLGMDIRNDPLHKEANDIHIGYFKNDKAVGTLILQNIGNYTFKMRQVAVLKSFQGKGIGQKMVLFSEKYALERGFKQIELNARNSAVPFYEKLGYQKIEDEFLEINIPHYKMIKKIV
ncbi:MAG: GNAT family N-acetyltransferase [Flavobacteriales bacterium]